MLLPSLQKIYKEAIRRTAMQSTTKLHMLR